MQESRTSCGSDTENDSPRRDILRDLIPDDWMSSMSMV